MRTLEQYLNPQDFSLSRILEDLCGESAAYPTEQLELARMRLIEFSKFIDPKFDANWHHHLVAEKLEAVGRGEIKKLMVLEPPRFGKTTQCSHHFPAWLLGRQDEAIVGCAYNETKATEESAQVQRIIASERYHALFPNAIIPKRSNAQAGHRQGAAKFSLIDRPRANYRAVGIGGSLTGFDKTLGLIDDPVKDQEDAMSPTIQKKVWDWYWAAYRTRDTEVLAGEAGIRDVLIMTCWSEGDLAGMIREAEGDEWEILRLPAFLTDATFADRHPQDIRQPMESLWPRAKNMDQLLELQRKRPAIFAAMFQQRPSADGGVVFHRSKFVDRYRAVPAKTFGYWFMAIDAAFEGKETSDRVSIQIWCVHFDSVKAFWIHDDTKVRDFNQTLEAIRALLKIYPQVCELVIEQKANGPAIISSLQHNIRQVCTPYLPRGSKLARALSVQPFVDAGCIVLPESSPWLEEATDEVCKFPRAKYDDRADAFSMALTKLVDSPLSGQGAWEALLQRR